LVSSGSPFFRICEAVPGAQWHDKGDQVETPQTSKPLVILDVIFIGFWMGCDLMNINGIFPLVIEQFAMEAMAHLQMIFQ